MARPDGDLRLFRRLIPSSGGVWILTALVAAAALAPWIAPFDPIHQFDPKVARYLPPGSLLWETDINPGSKPRSDSPTHETDQRKSVRPAQHRPETSKPHRFWLGTDRFGRDLLSRLIFGARTSLSIGLLAAFLATTLGSAVGGTAALGGPLLDGFLMRLVDLALAFPRLLLLIAMVAILNPSTGTVVIILGATGWMECSRLVRARVLSLRESEFALAAVSLGIPTYRILLRHLLPLAWTPILVTTTQQIGDLILVEAALSFLGLGVQPPTPSWGAMIAEGGGAMFTAWWTVLFPGLALCSTVISVNLIGDRLRDIFQRLPSTVVQPRDLPTNARTAS